MNKFIFLSRFYGGFFEFGGVTFYKSKDVRRKRGAKEL
ncbi:hypothetical protein CAMRE0001_1470 [Campylobacter rectus RM3267]|uniref:Uncharacterized protein n=1 Tax=Campylobacter rectus RM3267 TaxID=553218 RepID=B9D336_CAMRE|nr:hypothetical protein CAMRE0001_1470 [Campylobacter rectus RM3267]